MGRMYATKNGLQEEQRLKIITDSIRVVPHFPKPGYFFTLFHNYQTFICLYFCTVPLTVLIIVAIS